MKKTLSILLGLGLATSSNLLADSSEPLFRVRSSQFLSETQATYMHDVLRLGQSFSFGIKNDLSVGLGAAYQEDFDKKEDGLNNFDLNVNYRLSNSKIITDLLLGYKFGGEDKLHDMTLNENTYYGGVKVGKKINNFSFATTLKTSWIFKSIGGMAYINITPEMYYSLNNMIKFGGGFDIRKSTSEVYDQEWANLKAVLKYGRTEYSLMYGYEFESKYSLVGAKLNILF